MEYKRKIIKKIQTDGWSSMSPSSFVPIAAQEQRERERVMNDMPLGNRRRNSFGSRQVRWVRSIARRNQLASSPTRQCRLRGETIVMEDNGQSIEK